MSEAKRYLTAEDIFAADDGGYTDVEVPEWGGVITLRSLRADQAVLFLDQKTSQERAALLPKLVFQCAWNRAKGERLFTEPEQFELLKARSLVALKRCEDTLLEVNGLAVKKEDEEGNA